MLGAVLLIFLFQLDSLFVAQRPLASPSCQLHPDFPLAVSTAENPITKEKNARSLSPLNREAKQSKESSLIKDLFFQVFERDLIQLPSKLREKVYALPGIMQASRADSTINKYCNSFLRFKKWAKEQGIEESELFPSKPLHVSIYLACLVQRANSPSPIVDAFYGIKWAHDLVGFNSPTDNQFVKNIMEGGKRIVAKPVQKKEPITVENLRSGIQDDSEEYVFCAISKSGSGYRLRNREKPLSYTRVRELFIEAFTGIVDNIKVYGLHSLRSGGATASAVRGIPDRIFKRHGRWRSESAKDGYVQDPLSERLSVSKELGL
nr:uncharacterized protein LOC117688728 isoform X2 [Crassostrea gigas]